MTKSSEVDAAKGNTSNVSISGDGGASSIARGMTHLRRLPPPVDPYP
jgi:hypothetical protein